MLEVGIIQPRQISYSSPIILVHKNDGLWSTYSYYRYFKNITIKDKFPISVIDELLDELHAREIYFTKLDLFSGYHHIRMKKKEIPKTKF